MAGKNTAWEQEREALGDDAAPLVVPTDKPAAQKASEAKKADNED